MSLKDRIEGETAGSNAEKVTGVGQWRHRLLEEVDLTELDGLDVNQRRARLERITGHIISREGPVLSSTERAAVIRRVVDEALGLGVLEPLLADESVTEIMVNGTEGVYIERMGKITKVDTTFANEEQLYQTIDRIVSRVNRRVDESSPMVDARLPTGERVNVIVPPLALSGPTITIRRFPRTYEMHELVRMDSLDEPTAYLLAALVHARFNVVISGGTGSGKTTFLNALSGFIREFERIITIEDSAELQLQQEHVIRLESRPPNIEGKGAIPIRELVRNALRMRPDRIIVGEVRGAETLDMLQAMNTGHDGSLVTVHANSADDAIYRLETLASMSEIAIPYEAVRDQINNAIDVIVHLSRGLDGSRRVVEVAGVVSNRRESFKLQSLLTFEQGPMGADRVVRGTFKHHRIGDDFARRLALIGEPVPSAFAAQADDAPLRREAE